MKSKNPPSTNRPPAPPSSGGSCVHNYKVLNATLYKATFYGTKCLEIRNKEL